MPSRRVTDLLLFAAVFTMSFEKIFWNVAGKISLTEVISILFVVAYLLRRLGRRDGSLQRTAGIVIAFFAAFLLVYLIGFYNLGTAQALTQFGKGMGKFVLHFAFLVAAVDYLAHSSERVYWRLLAWFSLGVAANAAYGVLQLGAAQAGHNLDSILVRPLTGHSTQINIYGAVAGSNVYRVDGLTPDPNHLGIALIVPLLVLGPIYLRLERKHPLRVPLALLLAALLAVELATLSRSGLLGLVIASRLQSGGRSTKIHFQIYAFIPKVLHMHPLFGLGFNNFSVYYQFVTGKTNWGPHSFYVALVVETGVVGTVLFAVFLWYLFRRLKVARAMGRALAVARDPVAARVRPLAWGLTAALVGTMAANAFYLTMISFYFYAFALLVLALPVVFARRLEAAA